MQPRNYFQVLDIKPTKNIERVKAAYKRQVLHWNTDAFEAWNYLSQGNNLSTYYDKILGPLRERRRKRLAVNNTLAPAPIEPAPKQDTIESFLVSLKAKAKLDKNDLEAFHCAIIFGRYRHDLNEKNKADLEKVIKSLKKQVKKSPQNKQAILNYMQDIAAMIESYRTAKKDIHTNPTPENIAAKTNTYLQSAKAFEKKYCIKPWKYTAAKACVFVGGLLGGLIGFVVGFGACAAVGGGVGSVVPVLGTLIGAAAAGSVGGVVGALKGAGAGALILSGVAGFLFGVTSLYVSDKTFSHTLFQSKANFALTSSLSASLEQEGKQARKSLSKNNNK